MFSFKFIKLGVKTHLLVISRLYLSITRTRLQHFSCWGHPTALSQSPPLLSSLLGYGPNNLGKYGSFWSWAHRKEEGQGPLFPEQRERLVAARNKIRIRCISMCLWHRTAIKPSRKHQRLISFQVEQPGRNLTLKQDSSVDKPPFQNLFLRLPLLHWWSGLQSGCCALELRHSQSPGGTIPQLCHFACTHRGHGSSE